jgi:hypothetical protein
MHEQDIVKLKLQIQIHIYFMYICMAVLTTSLV